ncbi:MAG: RidA family protein [Longibaculum muris]|uniref:2-iminobutanoate/2-iminopropanoate deaminase n=1 Tax=Longibaculum muris TaxID=1796628 RepID=A0A4R3Z726_9FIRM|nr:RidA family protein [Longibaculum muris]KXU45392.1 putative endoribonuclease L-PSP [Candidatus Stoquefichus sp. KLE1796]MCR1886601.1 RidA family protein [Longibaculum muris]MED9813076.1 RidA family protein [Longibaculum muris]TCW01653.1 2-iminobutanoate/2-iminopropanoate deaminase [Longibaculum muris]
MKTVVKTDKAPGAIGPYSQGIDLGNMIFFSGQIPLNPQTGEMPEGIEAQAKQALENVKGLLESQGLDFSHVVKTTVFLDNMDDFNTVNGIYAQYFVEPYPARSAVEVAKLPKGALIEVEVIAVKS